MNRDELAKVIRDAWAANGFINYSVAILAGVAADAAIAALRAEIERRVREAIEGKP